LYGLTHVNIWVLPLVGDRRPRLFVKTPPVAYNDQFSPNDRWVAYTCTESGREEVYVVPFGAAKVLSTGPDAVASIGSLWQISPGGGRFPRWRRDGQQIFYLAPGDQMMAVEVQENGNILETEKAQPLFTATVAGGISPYDVTPDGQRFLINTRDNTPPLTLVVN
jgi:eukaryotic-like serine/threonine-protein kinase